MFRFLTFLFLTIFVLDLAVAAFETRRAWFGYGIYLTRKKSPGLYWLMTALWSLVAVGCVAGFLLLSYQALVNSGPYAEYAFLSLHQAWPYAATSVLFGWLAIRIIKVRLQLLRDRRAAQ